VSGEVTVSLRIPNGPAGRTSTTITIVPGLRHLVQLAVFVDGHPRIIDVEVGVQGAVCPEPDAHLLQCAETRYDRYGDCDGTVRRYVAATAGVVAATPGIVGVESGDEVLLCSSHAQMHGRHIRKPNQR
jgi:hypothetical protein